MKKPKESLSPEEVAAIRDRLAPGIGRAHNRPLCTLDFEAQEWGACTNGPTCPEPNHRGWFPDVYVGKGCQFTAGSLLCIRKPCPNPLHRETL